MHPHPPNKFCSVWFCWIILVLFGFWVSGTVTVTLEQVHQPDAIGRMAKIKNDACFQRKTMEECLILEVDDQCPHNGTATVCYCMWCEYWCLPLGPEHCMNATSEERCEHYAGVFDKLFDEPRILDIIPKIVLANVPTMITVDGRHLDKQDSLLVYNQVSRIWFNDQYQCNITNRDAESIRCVLEGIDPADQAGCLQIGVYFRRKVYGKVYDELKLDINYSLKIVPSYWEPDDQKNPGDFDELRFEWRMLFALVILMLFCSVGWIVFDKREFFKRKYHLVSLRLYLRRTKRMLVEKNLYVDFKYVRYRNKLGDGHFGEVYAATVTYKDGKKMDVAIKRLKNGANCDQLRMFITEGIRMSSFDHEHILAPLAIFMDHKKNHMPAIALPLMKNGDLCRYLRQRRMLPIYDLLKFSVQIAQGMEYLASKNFVHGDLAARNCLLDSDFQVKIGDFGLSRQLYQSVGVGMYSSCGPIRWMALECLAMKKPVFTKKSDVWSFGVLLWEIFTLGSCPYEELDHGDILQYLREGNRLEIPVSCPKIIYEIMHDCWNENVDLRPSFKSLHKRLEKFLAETYRTIEDEQCEHDPENHYEQIVYNKCIDYTSLANRYIQNSAIKPIPENNAPVSDL